MTNTTTFPLIRGCPRSGTYLLTKLLQERYDIAIPVETQFISLFARHAYLAGDLHSKTNRLKLTLAIFDYVELLLVKGFQLKSPQKQLEFSLLSVRDKAEHIANESESYSSIVHNIFKEYALQHGCRHYGDKSVMYKPESPETLFSSLPEAKVVYVVRDGRDTVLSWQKEWFGPRSTDRGAQLWSHHVDNMIDAQKLRPSQVHIVRYEELIEAPDDSLEKIASFLELQERTPDSLSTASGLSGVLGEDYHPMITSAVNPTNKDKWKKGMTDQQISTFSAFAHNELRFLNYPSHLAHHASIYRQAMTSGSDWLRKNQYLRTLRKALPALLIVRRKAGFSDLKLLTD